jgi:type I restriction enzyme M protein
MLIMAFKYAEEKHGREGARKVFLYGQEANQRTLALARMNMHIHDIRDVNLASGDTLLYPKFKDKDGVRTFHVVIANPPWNQDGYDEDVLKKGEFWKQRFSFGCPPRQSADWAWIQHMLASARERDGRIGVLLDNGCIFRSGREGGIRADIVRADLLDAIILLPEKLFYNTGAPGVLLILSKSKPKERKNRILFIDATHHFEKHPELKKLNRLGEKSISAIREAFEDYKSRAGFARIVGLDEIERNEFNLSVPRYVEATGSEEQVNIGDAWNKVQGLQAEREGIEKKLAGFLKELDL